MSETSNNIKTEDDGSLAFLRIPRDANSKNMIGDIVKMSKLVNTSFYVFGFMEDIPTRFSKEKGSKGQTLVQIRERTDSPESESKKFFTGSSDILYILREIEKRNAFPRRVTLRQDGTRFYFE